MASPNIIIGFLVALGTLLIYPAMASGYKHDRLLQPPPHGNCAKEPGFPLGCWLEGSTAGRLLQDEFLQDDQNMSLEVCADYCTITNNYTLFGVEYGSQCFCSDDIQAGAGFPIYDISMCNYPCAGNANETCGGYGALFIYQALPPPPPLPSGLINNYTYTASGCYAEPADGSRALDGYVNANSWQGTATCSQICGLSNFSYFGLEYADECWCGDSVSPLATLVDSTKCNMPCVGNAASGANETCGGSRLLNLYTGSLRNNTQALVQASQRYRPDATRQSCNIPVPVPDFMCNVNGSGQNIRFRDGKSS